MQDDKILTALFNFATEGILLTDDKGVILRINASAEKMFGYEKDELLNQKVEVLIPGAARTRHEKHRENYSHHPHARNMGQGMDLSALRKNGEEFPVEVSLSPFSSSGNKFIVVFLIDITIRKQHLDAIRNQADILEKKVQDRTMVLQEALHELEKSKEELRNALSKERELNEMKSRFVSMASHEFRTPLATILSSMSLVAKYKDPDQEEKRNKHIERIKSSVANMTDILNDFLSVSKLEEGKVETQPEEINIKAFITEIVQQMRLNAQKSQKITYTHSGETTDLTIDPRLLRNILFNLLSNAIKFTPAEGTIHVSSSTTKKTLEITVADEGIGIPEEDQPHLFERFFRASNATHVQGTGLGLSIVARYAELMNGNIRCSSVLNKGTTFILKFTLP